MNMKIFTAPTKTLLRCVWHSTGKPGTPLVCTWTLAGTARTPAAVIEFSSQEEEGLRLCA